MKIKIPKPKIKPKIRNLSRAKKTKELFDLIKKFIKAKRAKSLLRLQSEILNNMAEGVAVIQGEDNTIIYANPRFEEIFGFKPGELVGKNAEVLNASAKQKTPEQISQDEEIVISLRKTGTWSGEIQDTKRDGVPFWCQVRLLTIESKKYGTVWVGIHSDITDQKEIEKELNELKEQMNSILEERKKIEEELHESKKADKELNELKEQMNSILEERKKIEEELHESKKVDKELNELKEQMNSILEERKKIEEELRKSERYLHSAFETSSVGMAFVAPNGHLLKVNRRLCEIVGCPKEELLSRTFQDILHPGDLQIYLKYIRQILDSEIPYYQTEKEYTNKQGHTLWIKLNVLLIRDKDGNPLYFFSRITDITEQKTAQQLNPEQDAKDSQEPDQRTLEGRDEIRDEEGRE
ncbi:MAG: PAS domain S-box protein [Candidatus Omnitrophota bacterium]